jgi:AbrB family looped-hinge helix DNA binding protein
MATTLTSKGQVTIPKKVRELLGLKPGSSVEFELSEAGEVTVRPAQRGARRPRSRFGALRGRATVRMSTDEILALTRG